VRTGRSLLGLAVSAALLGLGVGCGSEAGEPGEVTISQSSQPDHLDPALASEIGGLEPLWLVYTPLLTYRHADGEEGAELIPGLATDQPEISGDGRTYTLELREDLSYSDGSPVLASDFEHAIERVLYLRSRGARFYEGIVGAEEYMRAHESTADIGGIRADDETRRITIELERPDAAFPNALAMSFAGLVPGETPFEDLTADPPPGVGPYEITVSEPNREFVLERNPVFDGLDIPDIPTGSLETITTRIVGDRREQAEAVLDGALDYMQDRPPAELEPAIAERAPDRYEQHAAASTDYFFLDAGRQPFDDPLVREAVNYGLDREALADLYAGTMQPGCALLAPGVPGYDPELDTEGCPYGDPGEPPDLERARALIDQAGAAGAKVIVRGPAEREGAAVTEAYAGMLDAIGLDARVSIGGRPAAAATGLESWSADIPHPLDLFGQLDLDDPNAEREVALLAGATDLDAVKEEWAALDAYLVSPPQSRFAPFGHREGASFFSERMDPATAIFHPVYRNDYSSWTLKEGE
jgi:peptide/nickel transport system substrate-binding protein